MTCGGHGPCSSPTGTARTRTVSPLTNGTTYTFYVRAHNSAGFGPSDNETAKARRPAVGAEEPGHGPPGRQRLHGADLGGGLGQRLGHPALLLPLQEDRGQRLAGLVPPRRRGRRAPQELEQLRRRLRVRLPGAGPQRGRLRPHGPDLGAGPGPRRRSRGPGCPRRDRGRVDARGRSPRTRRGPGGGRRQAGGRRTGGRLAGGDRLATGSGSESWP